MSADNPCPFRGARSFSSSSRGFWAAGAGAGLIGTRMQGAACSPVCLVAYERPGSK